MAEIPFLPGSLEPQDKFYRMADDILARRAEPKKAEFPRISIREEESDPLSFVVDFGDIIRQQINEVASATDGAFRRIIEQAYTAGFEAAADEAGRCCGCSVHHEHDPEGYVDALIQRLREES